MGRYFADHTTMGGSWEQAGPPNLIACSGSVRTRQTLSQWISGFCEGKRDCRLHDDEYAQISPTKLVPVMYDRTIYDAETGVELMHYLQHLQTDVRVLLLVAHSRGVDELLELLTGSPPTVHFSTCGMALLGTQLSGPDWKRPGAFWLLDYVTPAILANGDV